MAAMESIQSNPPQSSHGLGDSLAIIGLVVSLLAWALVPGFVGKVLAVSVSVGLLVYLAYKSHFTREVSRKWKHVIAAVIAVTIGAFAAFQLRAQWRAEHAPSPASSIKRVADRPAPHAVPITSSANPSAKDVKSAKIHHPPLGSLRSANRARASARSTPSLDYSRLSDQALAHEIIRVSSSLTAFAGINEARINYTTGVLGRAASGNPQPGDPSLLTAQETYFRQSKDFTDAIRDQYFPEIASLRAQALRRLDGRVQEDPQEKRNWGYITSYLESPPNIVSTVQMEEFAREFKKMGEDVDALGSMRQ